MPSTDIDGSVIVILSEEEARCVYTRLIPPLNKVEQKLLRKLERDLKL